MNQSYKCTWFDDKNKRITERSRSGIRMTNAFRTACQKTGYLVASLKTCVAARLARSGAGASLMKLSDRKRAALFHYAWVNTPIADIFQVKARGFVVGKTTHQIAIAAVPFTDDELCSGENQRQIAINLRQQARVAPPTQSETACEGNILVKIVEDGQDV